MLGRLVIFCLASIAALAAQTAFSVAGSIGNFHVAVSNYYHVPEREVIVIRERRIPEDEIPVVLFIAQRARVAPATIIDLRLGGKPWREIAVRFGLGPEVFYVPVAVTPGPPYGKAYGHYKKKPRHQWNTIVLADSDYVSLVNLRFLSDHYRMAPERVIELRGRHADFIAVNAEIGRGRPVRTVVVDGDDDDHHGKGKGKGKGHGKGRGHDK
jgi:hypothetical protein